MVAKDKFNWGILGCGNIANAFIHCLNLVPEAHLLAAASHTPSNRKKFLELFQIPTIYESYEELVADPNIDIIYIGTTQNFHFDNIKLALNHKKHVLCEKPLTLNATQANEVIQLAQQKNCFLMEALWMRFLPAITEIKKILAKGTLGNVCQVTAHFGYDKMQQGNSRLNNPNLGGGVMLDMGIYPLSFAQMVFNIVPEKITSTHRMTDNGVDGYSSYTLDYGEGKTALLSSSITFPLREEAIISCEKGYIRIPVFHGANRFYLIKNEDIVPHPLDELERSLDGKPFDFPYEKHGFQFEIQEVHKCITNNTLESSIMPWHHTIELLEMCDRMRNEWGFVYPNEINRNL